MRNLFMFCSAMVFTTFVYAGNPAGPFIGKWEYRQDNSGSETGFDPEGEQLELKETGGKLTGTYLGIERMGEEGLFYTATNVIDMKIAKGSLSFTVPGRSFYSVRPKSVAEASTMKESGFTRSELKMTGKIEGGKLILRCTSTDSSCPDDKLTFEKGKW